MFKANKDSRDEIFENFDVLLWLIQVDISNLFLFQKEINVFGDVMFIGQQCQVQV